MNPQPAERNLNRITFQPSLYDVILKPSLSGLCQSEKDAYKLVLEFMEPGQMSQSDKLSFLNAVGILSSLVRDQANGNMNNYYPKTLLAKKIETFILEESTEILDNNVRQQAMLSIVALSQVKPPFHLCQKLDLVNTSITSIFSLPLIMPSLDRKESASLYLQTNQALDDMLQALVMEAMSPNMLILQNFMEIILPWLKLSDKVHVQIRALGTISRLLRFICHFSDVSHMTSFSITGKLIATFSLFCLNPSQDICASALEALYYVFTILGLQRSVRSRTESILKNLQKHFRGNWLANMQNLTLFFRKFLTPEERADVVLVAMEAMTSNIREDVLAAAKMLKMILKYPLPEVAKVPEIIHLIYNDIDRVTEREAQSTIKIIFQLLVQSYTDEVILTLFKIKDPSQKGTHRSWGILASFPKGYEMIMSYLLQKLISPQAPKGRETGHKTEISRLIATRAIHELLLVPSQQSEVQTFFASLFVALLFRISSLVIEGNTAGPDNLHETEYVDVLSSSVEALKTLMRTSGYTDHMTYIQTQGVWELLVSPERHYDGITLLARSLVVKNCWHNRPVFSFLIRTLQDPECANYFTALVFLTELFHCPDVADVVDEVATNIMANWFKCEDLAIAHLFLQITEVFTKHKNTIKHLQILQPCVLSCCYSSNSDLVMEAFLMLQRILKDLTWSQASLFLLQLTFTLAHFFEEESEQLRLITFKIYASILAKVSRMTLIFPLKHQILNLLVLLVLHLRDTNADVVEVCRLSLCNIAAILGWSKLKRVFAKSDAFTILSALLKQERRRALWFLKQSVALFKSLQASIRQVAVWFTGQILRILDRAEKQESEAEYAAFRYMQRDSDPMVSCLTVQTLYILEAMEKAVRAKTPSSCPWMSRFRRRHC
ncbi:maestro heat-like repeat-containing protein family member 7 [Acomys russatus]|uniref:maestro heat-like repeat-containing protein family member 7 n=1 Tax=Acomys russatus TaxID=60746 RepID=UPI0021E1CBC5|nr:maestro heat-like repeat-containing protein family member 7 [Acomys russatus]